LTLVSTLVLVIILAIFGGGVYVLLERNLRSNLDHDLQIRSAQVISVMRLPGEGGFVFRGLGFGRPDIFIQIIDESGDVLARSEALGDVRIPVGAVAAHIASSGTGVHFGDVAIQETALRVRTAALHDQFGHPAGALMVAVPLDNLERTLERLRQILLLAGVGGVALAAALSWRSARTALRPVEEIAAAAHEIGVTADLSRRVPPGSADELRRLSESFNTMLGRLEAAQQALSRSLDIQRRFVDDASHELRTPLTIMRGNLEVVARNPDMAPTERADALRDSIEEAERMTRLVDDLLALARVDAGMPLPDDAVALAPLVREVADGTHPAAGERIVSVTIGSPEATVRGSAGLLRRVLENLTDNAIKYTGGRGAVSISLVEERDQAVMTVADDGIGMTPEELAHAFDRFWRSDSSRERPGSGLGLSIAKTAVEAHGGTIEATSEPDAGTTFTVRLPLASKPPSEPADHGVILASR
jgi:signal transduction histidine kinase